MHSTGVLSCVTKTLSLDDDAFEALLLVKRPGESDSDLVRRLARLAAQTQVFERSEESPVWTDAEVRARKEAIHWARGESVPSRV
jgi:predicted CopG family antitoxin